MIVVTAARQIEDFPALSLQLCSAGLIGKGQDPVGVRDIERVFDQRHVAPARSLVRAYDRDADMLPTAPVRGDDVERVAGLMIR